jgi:methionine-gamma-lyase
MSRFGVESTFLDTSRLDLVEAAIKPNTKVLYVETPANPTISITDISACAKIAAKHGIKLVVDNTFCSPYLQNPLELGADVVLHSVTKFINGHADVVGGVIVTKTAEDHKLLYNVMTTMGPNMDPHQAYLVIRGIKTLSLRMERAQANAQKIAEYLEAHPAVAWVRYPGLKSHPQYELAQRQQKGPGAMISFGLKGGLEAGKKLMNSVKLAALAVSLGGVETLIQHPASMTHAKVSSEAKLAAGITDDLVRYSVGIENVDDLIADLELGL